MTENETITLLMKYLEATGWQIDSHCLGQEGGNDIVANKDNKTLIVEAKGAKANDNSPTKKRDRFDSSQLKTHYGVAIVKILEEKHKSPNSLFAIAHPDDPEIRKVIEHLIPILKPLAIAHYWVSPDGTVIEE